MKYDYILICKKCKRVLIIATRDKKEQKQGKIEVELNTHIDKYYIHLTRCFSARGGEPQSTIRYDLK